MSYICDTAKINEIMKMIVNALLNNHNVQEPLDEADDQIQSGSDCEPTHATVLKFIWDVPQVGVRLNDGQGFEIENLEIKI